MSAVLAAHGGRRPRLKPSRDAKASEARRRGQGAWQGLVGAHEVVEGLDRVLVLLRRIIETAF